MIEDRDAIEQIDEITAVEGIDGFFLGRGDLGLSLSNATGPAPTLEEAVRIVAESVLKNGKTLCAVTQNKTTKKTKKKNDLGGTVLMVASDHGILRSGFVTQIEHFRKLSKT